MRKAGERLSAMVMAVLGWAVILLACAIVLQVAANALDLNPLWTFDASVPLLGGALTLNGLLDLQWHLLAAIALLPAGLVWLRDRHVRVDVIQSRLSTRGKAVVDLAGNLIFAVPFFILIVPAALGFMWGAWRVDEGSANGGLVDLWAIKALLPLGLGLLGLAIAFETIRLMRVLLRR